MGYIFSRTILCGIAGVIAWLIVEPQFPTGVGGMYDPEWTRMERLFTLLIGGLVGLAGGLLAGFRRGSKTHLVISAGAGLILGMLAGLAGHAAASVLYEAFIGTNQVIARALAFIPLGMLIGAAVGSSQFSWRGVLSGLLGGAVAGLVTGITFDAIATSLSFATLATAPAGTQQEVGAPGRAALAAGIGLFVGLFTAIVDVVSRTAWIKILSGSRKGREFPIDASEFFLGRDERAHIPLFGDMNVEPLAAIIRQTPSGHEVVDPGTQIGIGVNGQRVQGAPLNPGDQIQIGSHRLLFLTKARSVQTSQPVGQQYAQQLPQPYGGAQPAQPYQSQPHPTQPHTTQPQSMQPGHQQTQATQQSSPPTLVAVGGPQNGGRFPIFAPIEVGREIPTIPLSHDQQCSRRHARLEPTPDGVQVVDLGSTNGTYLNGARIATATARRGDMLRIGSTEFRVE